MKQDSPSRPKEEPSDALELLYLIRSGMLFELQHWIEEGKPLSPCGKRSSAIVEAAASQFHSMVCVLLEHGSWTEGELVEATQAAALDGSAAMVLMLLQNPGIAPQLTPSDLGHCLDYDVWLEAIKDGMPLQGDDGFGPALVHCGIRPLLRLYRDLHQQYPEMEQEARRALEEVVRKGSPRGVALLIWAGVDPLQPWYNHNPDDEGESEPSPYHYAPAVIQAIRSRRIDLLKLMKLQPSIEQWLDLLEAAAGKAHSELLDFMLRLRADCRSVFETNPGRSSKVLMESLKSITISNSWWFQGKAESQIDESVKSIRLLLEVGARLGLETEAQLYQLRRRMYEALDQHVGEATMALASIQEPKHQQAVMRLANKPKFRMILRLHAPHLHALWFPAARKRRRSSRQHQKPK